MNAGLEKLAGLAAEFYSSGGTIVGPFDIKQLPRKWRGPLVRRKASLDEERYLMLEGILSSKDTPTRPDSDQVYVALDTDGLAVGAVKCEEFFAYKNLQVNFLASTGEVKGTGAALLVAATAYALEYGWGLGLLGEDAEEYYEKLGMHAPPAGMAGVSYWWTPEEVVAIQSSRGVALNL
jgi:hypothetical protein